MSHIESLSKYSVSAFNRKKLFICFSRLEICKIDAAIFFQFSGYVSNVNIASIPLLALCVFHRFLSVAWRAIQPFFAFFAWHLGKDKQGIFLSTT